jgi:hypothetical protein
MDANMEIGEDTRFEVFLAVLLRFQVANMYWLFPFWSVGFLRMKAQCFLEAWGQLTHPHTSSYPSKRYSLLKDSFVATGTLSSLACELLDFLDSCSTVRSVSHSVFAWYLRVIQNHISLATLILLTWRIWW